MDQVLSTTGRPLDASIRTFFEARLRRDFAAVRVQGAEPVETVPLRFPASETA